MNTATTRIGKGGAEEAAHLNREIQNRWAIRLDVGGADLIQFAP